MTAERSIGLIKLTNSQDADELIALHHSEIVSVVRDRENPAFVRVFCSDGREYSVTESLEEIFNLIRNCQ